MKNNDFIFLLKENEKELKKNKNKNINKKILALIAFIINCSFLIFNIIYYLKKKLIHNEKILSFKNSDNLIINILKKTFIDISNYLNNKYTIIIINNINKAKIKKRLKIYSVDLFNRTRHKKWLKQKFEDKFIIEYDKDNPDYLIFNIFGKKHHNPKYRNAIKIGVFTENSIPDLNEVDYALGHSHINYFDRFFKHSILLWKDCKGINEIRKNVLKMPIRTKFCGAVISNSYKANFRLKFINVLNKYKRVDMGGGYRNNIGGQVKNKIKFFSSYKFSLAIENSNGDGYVSEKIIQSFIAGTIPIYYGDYLVDEYINPKSYILIKGEKDIDNKIEYIKSIDNDNEKYRNILREKVIVDNNFIEKIDDELKSFLYNIFQQEKSKSRRIDSKF
jgi:hypothetical protein